MPANDQVEAQTTGSQNGDNDSIARAQNQANQVKESNVLQTLVVQEQMQGTILENCGNIVRHDPLVNWHPPTYSTSAYNPHVTPHCGTSYLATSSQYSSPLRTHSHQAPTIIAPTGQEHARNQQPRRVGASRQNGQAIHSTDGDSSRSNDSGSMARKAMHINKLFSSKERKYSGNNDEG